MMPRGVIIAASVKEVNLPVEIPVGKTPQGPGRSGAFQKQLVAESQKQGRIGQDGKPDKAAPEEGKRTEGSHLGKATKEPGTSAKPKGADSKKENAAPHLGNVVKAEDNQGPVQGSGQVGKAVDVVTKAIDEWLAGYLKTMVQDPDAGKAPGGNAGLNEVKLGPRFASPAPNAITLLRDRMEEREQPASPVAAHKQPQLSGDDSRLVNQPVSSKPDQSPVVEQVAAQNNVQLPEAHNDATRAKFDDANIKSSRTSEPSVRVEGQKVSRTDASPVDKAPVAGSEDIEHVEVSTNSTLQARLAQLINDAKQAALRNASDKPDASRVIVPNTKDPGAELKLDIKLVDLGQQTAPMKPPEKNVDIFLDKFLVAQDNQVVSTGNGLASAQFKDAPVPAQTIIDDPNLAAQFQRIVQEGSDQVVTSVRFTLHPPELGHIVVDFRHDDNGLRVQFHTHNPAVWKELEEAGPKMMDRLQQAGIDIGSLDVFLNNQGNDGQGISSPLDNPGRPPSYMGPDGFEGITEDIDQGWIPGRGYLAYDDSVVDMLV